MIDMKDVKALLVNSDDHTLTLYADVSEANIENQAVAPQWAIWLKNRLRDLEHTLSGDDAKAWPEIRAWVDQYLAQYAAGRKPQARGLVLFAGPSSQHAYELPVPFENRISFGHPQVTPLLWAIDEYEPYLVALFDKEKARFFTSYLASMSFEDSLEIDLDQYDFVERPLMPATAGGHEIAAGTNKEAWQRTINEHLKRFYRQIAETAVKLADKSGANRLILAGSEDSLPEVHKLLDTKAQARVAGMVTAPLYETTAQLFERVFPVAQTFEREQEVKLVSEVIDFAKSGGRGALGREAVDMALEMQRVEKLILPWPVNDATFQSYTEDLAYRTLQLNGSIELVHGAAADRLASEGGVAARLYYALDTQPDSNGH